MKYFSIEGREGDFSLSSIETIIANLDPGEKLTILRRS